MKKTISILVENHAGVLSRICGLFSRRGFNIDSLAVGVTDDPKVSRITIVANGSDYTLEQLEKQLNKLIEVIKVRTLENEELLAREIMTIAQITKARIVDISQTTMTLEISDTAFHLKQFEDLIRPYGIMEMVRTGTIAIQKGTETISLKK